MGTDVKRMEKRMTALRMQIDELTARALAAGTKAGHATHAQIDDFKARYALMQARLDRANAAGGSKPGGPDKP